MSQPRDTETLDKLYLEWSQFTDAKTLREIALERRELSARTLLAEVATRIDAQPGDELLAVLDKRLGDLHSASDDLAFLDKAREENAKLRAVAMQADGELSAIGHGRPVDKDAALRISAELRRIIEASHG